MLCERWRGDRWQLEMHERFLDETASLLRSRPNDVPRNKAKPTTVPRQSWRHLRIPLEGLLLSCMVPILQSCCSHAELQWPLLRRWIIGFEWANPVIDVVYLSHFGAMVWCSTRPPWHQIIAGRMHRRVYNTLSLYLAKHAMIEYYTSLIRCFPIFDNASIFLHRDINLILWKVVPSLAS